MNRLKLWLYVLLLLGAGAGNLYFLTGWLSARSIAHIDRELRSAAAVADARVRLLGASAGVVADAAARAPAVVAAMADPAASPLGPAEDAVAAAASGVKNGSRSTLVAIAGPQGVSARAGGAEGKNVAAPEALLAEAQAGRRAQAWVRLDGTMWMVAAAPAGRGGAVAVGLALDESFVKDLGSVTGVVVTAAIDGKAVATSATADAAELASLPSATTRRPVDVGRLGSIKAALDWPTPPMPILFADPPAARALALPLDGAGPATLVLAQYTAPFFSGLAAYQVLALVAMALFLLVGVLLGLFMSEEAAPRMPRELVSAADRISRGDFAARAPALAGSAGTIAAALNRAAEAAQQVGRRPVDSAAPAQVERAPAAAQPEPVPAETAVPAAPAAVGDFGVTQPLFLSSMGEPTTDATRDDAPAAEAASDSARVTGEAAPDGAFAETASASEDPAREPEPASAGAERAPEAEARAAQAPESGEPQQAPEMEPQPGSSFAAAEPPSSAPPAFSMSPDDDEPHWRSVFADFLRLRSETGEPADALTYERFRARLERNREQLKDKHRARTVRFQPYLKDGKVALRATPVK